MRDGFYYFASPSTPFYPGFHQLGSRDWTSDEREPPPVLGEYNGTRTFYRGDPPSRIPLPVLVGTPDCIENGEAPGLPIIPDQSPFCGQILPDACYGPEELTKAATNVLDCVFGKKSADIINFVYTDLTDAEDAAFALLGPLSTVTSFNQPDAFTPSGVIGIVNNTAVVWLNGTTTFEQLAAQALYLGVGLVSFPLYSTSGFYEAAALKVADVMNAAGTPAAARLVLVGHSFGGAVAAVLATKIKLVNPGKNVELLTYGMPSPGDSRLVDIIATVKHRHYINLNDPIPYLPPEGILFAGLIPIIGPLLVLLWNDFAKPKDMTVVTEDGEFTTISNDELPGGLITVAAIAIASFNDLPTFKNHRIDWYAYYLCLACPCVPRPCVAPPEPVLGFQVELDNLVFDQGAGAEVLTFPLTTLAVTHTHPGGKPDVWEATIAGVAHIAIEAAIDGGNNYTSFTVHTDPDPTPPLWLCDWTFTAAEMMGGIDTSDAPDDFADTFISLDSLIVVPSGL